MPYALFPLLEEIDHDGQVVGIAVEPHSTRRGALGASLVGSLGLEEVGHSLHLVFPESQCGVVALAIAVDKVRREDDLVEEIPSPFVKERSLAALEDVVPRIVHVAVAYLFGSLLCRQAFVHALVHGVVVHIAHDEDLPGGVGAKNGVFQGFHLRGALLAIGWAIKA